MHRHVTQVEFEPNDPYNSRAVSFILKIELIFFIPDANLKSLIHFFRVTNGKNTPEVAIESGSKQHCFFLNIF